MPALRVTDDSEKGFYLALSYCWGGPQEVIATSSSLQSMTEGIPLESLPKTIRDAVTLTRSLRFKYLWIDALCIIQDSDADKIHEINEMGTVYRNATLTIAAASAQGVHEGFLEEFLPPHSCIVPLKLPGGRTGRVYFSKSLEASSRPINPLDLRAWALQEEMLSSRILYFGKSGVWWECRSEYQNLVTEDRFTSAPQPRLPHIVPQDAPSPWISRISPLLYLWKMLVENYSRRALTFPEDRLPALAGIAGQIQRSFHIEGIYLAGIWQDFLIEHLGWYDQWHDMEQQAKTPLGVRSDGPTWSWASFGGPVVFNLLEGTTSDFPSARLISAETFLDNPEAPLGRVRGGKLVLDTVLAQFSTEMVRKVSRSQTKTEFRMDYGQDQLEDQETLRYMFLGRDTKFSEIGLILRPKPDETFERVGQLISRGQDVWQRSMARQIVTLV
jgi:hypothetical protein